MKIKLIIAVVVLALAGAVGYRVVKTLSRKPERAAAEKPLVSTVRVTRADVPVTIRMTGTVRARNEVDVFPKLPGRVESVEAQVGDRVRAGQLLAWIDHKEIAWQAKAAEAALSVARANLDGAKLEFDRTQAVFEGGAAAASQLDGANVRLKLAQAQVAQAEAAAGLARQQVQNARIESPIAGTVTKRTVNLGTQVGPQSPLFTVQDVAALKLESSVDAAGFARLAKGQDAEVEVDSLPGVWKGQVSLLSPSLDPQSRRASVEIEIDNAKGQLLPNMFARVVITLGVRQQALVVPREAVLESPEGVVVYRIQGDRVERVAPKLGEGDGKQVIVESGLEEGDVVAASGLAELTAGAAVRLSDPARSGTGTVGQNP